MASPWRTACIANNGNAPTDDKNKNPPRGGTRNAPFFQLLTFSIDQKPNGRPNQKV